MRNPHVSDLGPHKSRLTQRIMMVLCVLLLIGCGTDQTHVSPQPTPKVVAHTVSTRERADFILRWLTILAETADEEFQKQLNVLKPLGDHLGDDAEFWKSAFVRPRTTTCKSRKAGQINGSNRS